ncbi:MAG: hypothetical protein QHH07_05950 [Sedimentisphaerales bacterium]|nr:hypothetical protein [Sedimentisphaerales bacterium]
MDTSDQICKECPGSHRCQLVYAKMGSPDIPPVTRQVIAAFLMPLAALIGGWVITERLLATRSGAVFGPLAGIGCAILALVFGRIWCRKV